MALAPSRLLHGLMATHSMSLSGSCVRCQVHGGCGTRAEAVGVLTARQELPRRAPGATRPELLGARRVTA
jgi:hypothetical protein